MEKTIIALRGRPDSGKTTAITLAHRELCEVGKSVYSMPRYDATELKEVVEIDGVNVGFASAGDIPHRLERSLRFLFDWGCVVMVCAARLNRFGEPFHKTIDAVDRFAEEHRYHVKWIDKPRRQDGRNEANSRVADEIVARVRKAVREWQVIEAELSGFNAAGVNV